MPLWHFAAPCDRPPDSDGIRQGAREASSAAGTTPDIRVLMAAQNRRYSAKLSRTESAGREGEKPRQSIGPQRTCNRGLLTSRKLGTYRRVSPSLPGTEIRTESAVERRGDATGNASSSFYLHTTAVVPPPTVGTVASAQDSRSVIGYGETCFTAFGSVALGSLNQWCVAFVIESIHLGTEGEHPSGEGNATSSEGFATSATCPRHRSVQHRIFKLIPCVQVGTLVTQQSNHLGWHFIPQRKIQRCLGVLVPRRYIGTGRQQCIHHLIVL